MTQTANLAMPLSDLAYPPADGSTPSLTSASMPRGWSHPCTGLADFDEDQLPTVGISAIALGFATEGDLDDDTDLFSAIPPQGQGLMKAPPAQGTVVSPRREHAPPDISLLPAKMRNACRWLVYRLVPSHKSGGEPRKVPYYVTGVPRGETDTPKDQEQLATLDQALAALETGRYAGLGFALGPDDQGGCWQGLDFDDRSQHPELEPLMADLPGYVEWSPSGDGLHAIGYGPLFQTLPANGSGIEAYAQGRFFTVTTNVVCANDPVDLGSFVRDRLTALHRSGTPAPTTNFALDWDPGELPEYIKNLQGVGNLADFTAGIYPDQDLPETPANIARVSGALATIPANCGNEVWAKALWSVASLEWDCGEDLARAWSQTAPDLYDDQSFADTWRRADPARIGIGHLFGVARGYGWTDTAVTAAIPDTDATTQVASDPFVAANPFNVSAESEPATTAPLVPLDLTDLHNRSIASPSFVVDYLLPRDHVTLLAGHGGTGKSQLGLIFASHVAAGVNWSQLRVQRGRVVLFSFEDGADLIYHRLRLILNGYGLNQTAVASHLQIFDLTDHGPLVTELNLSGTRGLHKTETWAAVAAAIDGADLVIIDNASDAYDGDENSRRQVRRFLSWLRNLVKPHHGALLLLAHVDKNTAKYGGASNSYSGSTAWHNSARSRLVIANDQLVQEKLNVGRALATPIDLEWVNGLPMPLQAGVLAARLQTQDDSAVLQAIQSALGAGKTINAAPSGSNTPWHCLQHEHTLPPELRETTGKKRVQAAISRLAAAGTIRPEPYKTQGRREGTRWVLATPGASAHAH